MPTLPPIPDYLIPLFVVIITPLSGWLNDDGLSKWVNGIITGAIVLIFAFVCAYLTHSLSGDLLVSFMAVASFCYILLIGPLASLHRWLVLRAVSPLRAFAPDRPPQTAHHMEAVRPPREDDDY